MIFLPWHLQSIKNYLKFSGVPDIMMTATQHQNGNDINSNLILKQELLETCNKFIDNYSIVNEESIWLLMDKCADKKYPGYPFFELLCDICNTIGFKDEK